MARATAGHGPHAVALLEANDRHRAEPIGLGCEKRLVEVGQRVAELREANCARYQRLLQGARQRGRPGFGRFGPLLGEEQLAFVRPAFGGIEDRGTYDDGRTFVVALEHRVDEDRYPLVVDGHQLERDGADPLLHLQHRCKIGLVADPPAGSQEVGERPQTDEVVARVPGEGEERLVHRDDHSVGRGRHVAARRVVVELFGSSASSAS